MTVPEETLPVRALRRLGPVWAALAVMGFLLVIVLCAATAGFRAGVAKNASQAATETAAETARQYALGLQDMAEGHWMTAADRFRFVLSLEPAHVEAALRLAEVEAHLNELGGAATEGPAAAGTEAAVPAAEALAGAQAALAAEQWDEAISLLKQVQATEPDFEPAQVRDAFHWAYRQRGLARIVDFRLQEGIFDLNLAEGYGALDEETEARRVWATLYVRGNALWGAADWPTVIAIFEDLYLAAPYFHDTMDRLHGAHLAYGELLLAQGDGCGAVGHFARASEVQADPAADEQRLAAEAACALDTLTPEAAPEETPAP